MHIEKVQIATCRRWYSYRKSADSYIQRVVCL
jgi:hypothetical protein